jgi:hypothetical protein
VARALAQKRGVRRQEHTSGDLYHFRGTLADLSQFGGFELAKPFKISERYPKVFTTGIGGLGVEDQSAETLDALIRGGGWEGKAMWR